MDESYYHAKPVSHCFCQLPLADLKKWAYSKYVEKRTTAELFSMAQSDFERECVSLVAMLDVSPEELDVMLHHNTREGCKLERCRDGVKSWLHVICDEEGKKE